MHGLYDGGHRRRHVTTGRRSRRTRSAPAASCGCSPTKGSSAPIATASSTPSATMVADGIAELRRERDGAGRVGRQANDDDLIDRRDEDLAAARHAAARVARCGDGGVAALRRSCRRPWRPAGRSRPARRSPTCLQGACSRGGLGAARAGDRIARLTRSLDGGQSGEGQGTCQRTPMATSVPGGRNTKL